MDITDHGPNIKYGAVTPYHNHSRHLWESTHKVFLSTFFPNFLFFALLGTN